MKRQENMTRSDGNHLAGLEIYTTPGCGWAQRNYAALIEKGLEFSVVMAKDVNGNKKTEFLALSPYGKTPVLAVRGVAIWDSLAINEYIEDAYPYPALLPTDPIGRAQARLWMNHCDQVLFPLLSGLAKSEAATKTEPLRALTKGLSQLEAFGSIGKSSGPFWMGQQIGLVDLCYATFFESLLVVEAILEMEAITWPAHITAWQKAIEDHPSIREAGRIFASLSLEIERTLVAPEMGVTHVRHG